MEYLISFLEIFFIKTNYLPDKAGLGPSLLPFVVSFLARANGEPAQEYH